MAAVCKVCGVPKLVTRTHTWRDGCIVDNASGAANLCMYEVSSHNTLVDEVSDILGIPIDNIIYNAGRRASFKVLMDMFSAHPVLARVVLNTPLYRLFQKSMVQLGRAIGIGGVEMLELRNKKGGKVRFKEPYHLAHCIAIIAGAFQFTLGSHVEYTVTEDEEGAFIINVTGSMEKSTEEEEAFLRLATADLVPSRQDGLDLPLCPKCKAPQDIGDLYHFDLERGVITERKGGDRVILIGLYSLNAIIRELERELGYDINDLFIKVEKENFKRKLEGSLKDEDLWSVEAVRRYLALRGMGSLKQMKEGGGKTTLTVSNVFIPPLVAGRLLALCEKRHHKECTYYFEANNNALRLEIPT